MLSTTKSHRKPYCQSMPPPLLALFVLAILFPPPVTAEPVLGCTENGLTPVFGSNWGTSLYEDETWVLIDGDPLLIAVGSRGSTAVYVCQPEPKGIRPQYYQGVSWGTNVWLNGTDAARHYVTRYYDTINRLTAGSQSLTLEDDVWTVTTVMGLGSDAELAQVVTYRDGNRYYRFHWELTNLKDTELTDLRFIHGGDTYFGGQDNARSWWNADRSMVYINNSSFLTSGIMGFYGSQATPPEHYFGGQYITGVVQAKSSARLDDTVDSSYVDAGYQLEWDLATLAAGETWTIEAFEFWTDPTFLTVIPPEDQFTEAESTLTLQYFLQNMDTSAYTIDLAASSDLGWTTNLPGGASVQLSGLASSLVSVEVTVPAASVGTTSTVSLTANEPIWHAVGTGSTNVEIDGPSYVSIVAFNATRLGDRVNVTWQTGTEVDTAGFNLWRSATPDGLYDKINDGLVAAQGTIAQGASYAYADRQCRTLECFYKLEEIDTAGLSTLHGPVQALSALPFCGTSVTGVNHGTWFLLPFAVVTGLRRFLRRVLGLLDPCQCDDI